MLIAFFDVSAELRLIFKRLLLLILMLIDAPAVTAMLEYSVAPILAIELTKLLSWVMLMSVTSADLRFGILN